MYALHDQGFIQYFFILKALNNGVKHTLDQKNFIINSLHATGVIYMVGSLCDGPIYRSASLNCL